jgi:hypothetical protein
LDGSSDLVVPSGVEFVANTPRTFDNITIGGTVSVDSNWDAEDYKVDFAATGDIAINNGGIINVNDKGYGRGQGPGAGVSGSEGAGGGAYGGNGGDGRARAGGEAYGSYSAPDRLGSGGGDYNNHAGYGGGAVKLVSGGTITVDGTITANGGHGYDDNYHVSGGGSGGSIWLVADTLAGVGSLYANGGGAENDDRDGGGGSGGRIAFHYNTDNSSFTNLFASGDVINGGDAASQSGGAGTIFKKSNTDTYGHLIIDNSNVSWSPSEDRVAMNVIDDGAVFDSVLIRNKANVVAEGTFTATDLTLGDDGWLFVEPEKTINYTNLSWDGGFITDNGGNIALLDDEPDFTVPTNSTFYANSPRTFSSLTIDGLVTHSPNTDTEVYKIDYIVNGDVLISPSGDINLDSKGYSDGNGPGAGINGANGAGGGGYGGAGGDGQTTAGGVVYGDETAPDRLGSAGGQYNYHAGHGGGAVKIIATGDMTVNGDIRTNGGHGYDDNYHVSGGGSGGSIWLSADTFMGTGNLYANGGGAENDDRDGGGGGGGRIAIYYALNNSSLNDVQVNGGVPNGSASAGEVGTIFFGGKSADPINLRQFKSDGTTAVAKGANIDEGTMVLTFQVQDGDDSDVLTPEVEFVDLSTSFNDVATNIGDDVVYSGSIVTASVTIDALADSESYHWQARSCDQSGLCSNWVSYGNNAETEADVGVVLNTDPNTPTIPESSFFINGQFTNSTQPELGFVLTDPNSLDSVKYQIQIDDNDDFSSPVADYSSVLATQGTRSFTVGQAVGSGSYSSGEEGQELITGNYYWRVRTIDDKDGQSDWATASGSPAFRIDQSRPDNATNMTMKAHDESLITYNVDDDTTWFSNNDLYFSWDAGTDAEGVKGYCVYLGTDSEGDPATQKGLLGDSPVSTTGTTCEFITDQISIDFSSSALRSYEWLSSSNSLYYFKVKTVDVANNIFVGADDTNLISFYFDNTAPENVAAISAPSGSFSNTADMYFTWPTIVGQAGTDAHSGILGFQYAINTQSNWIGGTTDPNTGLDYYSLGETQPFYLSGDDQDQIQLGQNIVYFRTLDLAGNNSGLRTAYINYGGEAPDFEEGDQVAVTPTQSEENNFAFVWPEADASAGRSVASYYYMINTPPPVSYATITSNSATYIATTENTVEAASIPGLRKGANTIYVVAVDDAGNYSPTNTISATFYLKSEIPDPPANLTVSDSSIKDASIWRAALVWSEPDYTGTGDLTYHVQRSSDAETWAEITNTTGLAHIDTVDESQRYYWRVGTTDNSDESIAAPSYSSAVSIIPKGTYTVPPDLTSGPAASSITTTKSTISWTTSRTGDSKISYGLASGNYFDSEAANSDHVTEHSIELNNLSPGTTYYYKARWTDEDGNTGESDEKTFETEPPPEVKDVSISSLGVSSGILNFTTENATKAKIYYGTTTSFGGVKEIATSKLETSYSVEIDKLEDGTKYYFRINTFDEEDEEYEGTILDFTTMPRPRVSGVRVQQVANTAQSSLLVTWESNTDISSVVTYYPVNNPALIRDVVDLNLQSGEHQMLIKGLFPDTSYVIRVSGKDIIGNQAVSDNLTITTSADSRAPMISELTIEGANSPQVNSTAQTTTSQLIVSWDTDEPATSQVEYGEGSGEEYSQLSQEDQDLSYNHVVIISGLTPSKVYHLRAISRDSAGNESKSIDTVTITPKATDNAFDLVITNLKEAFGFLGNL